MIDLNETDENKLDVVIKTAKRDLIPYLQLQRDLLKHSQLQGQVYVTVPAKHYSLFRNNIDPSFELITDQQILDLANYYQSIEDNWFTQQLIKLLSFLVVKQKAYLVIDANTLINKDFDESSFRLEDKWLYGLEQLELIKSTWEKNTRLFLGLSPTPIVGFRPVNQIFIKRNLQTLLNYIEHQYQADSITTLLQLHSQEIDTDPPLWTEFTLYGFFVKFLLETSGHYFDYQHEVLYFNPFKNIKIKDSILKEMRKEKPLMVKVYKRRPSGILSLEDYETAVQQVKNCYEN